MSKSVGHCYLTFINQWATKNFAPPVSKVGRDKLYKHDATHRSPPVPICHTWPTSSPSIVTYFIEDLIRLPQQSNDSTDSRDLCANYITVIKDTIINTE